MKIKIAICFLLCVFFLAACGGVTPYSTPSEASPTFIIATTKPLPTLTNTPTLTPIPWNTPTPETLYGYPTPEPMMLPTCDPFEGCMMNLTPDVQRRDFTFHELYVGKYVLRNWCNVDSQFTLLSLCAVTLSSKNSEQIEIWGYPAYLRKETGADLTGNGKPAIVIVNPEGNCCVETIVYEAGDTLKKILDVWSQDSGTFTDLNNDGTFEYIAPTRIWSKFCLTCQAWTDIVYEYNAKVGYMPATSKFKDGILSFDTQKTLDYLAQFTKRHPSMAFHFLSVNVNLNNPSGDDKEYQQYDKETNWEYSSAVNALYRLTVYYLLAGQKSDAQNILYKYFPPDKASEYMLAIQQDLQGLLAP